MEPVREYFNINKKEYWEKKYSRMIDESRIRSDSHHLDKFMPFFSRSDVILDFGSGLGGNIKYLSNKLDSKEFFIVEQSEVSINFMKTKLLGENDERGNQFHYSTEIKGIKDCSTDMIICIEVLEHITAYREIIDSLWSKLKGGGVFLLSVPVKGIRDRNREHVNKFTVSSMFRILTHYSDIVTISPRTYSKRSARLSTAYFLIEKASLLN